MKENLKLYLLAIVGISLAFTCVVWGFNLWQKPPEERKFFPRSEKREILPKATLSFSPQELTQHQGESFTVNILIKSGKEVSAVDLYLSYDNQILEIEKISPGKFFTEPKELSKEINKIEGRVFYAVGSFTPTAGEGILASLTFKGKVVGKQARVLLENSTQVAVQDGEKVNLELPKAGSYTILKSTK